MEEIPVLQQKFMWVLCLQVKPPTLWDLPQLVAICNVKVSGVRRIWGTLKSTSALTISSILRCSLHDGMCGRTHRWFIVKGSENDLEKLYRERMGSRSTTSEIEITRVQVVHPLTLSPPQKCPWNENQDTINVNTASSMVSDPNTNNDSVIIMIACTAYYQQDIRSCL